MQKSKTFRYGYDVGDFLSSAFSGWLFWVDLFLLTLLIGETDRLPGVLSRVSDYWMRSPGEIALGVLTTLFFVVVYTELIGLCRFGRRIVSTVLLAEYLVFAGLLLSNVEGVGDYPVLFAALTFLVPILLRVVSTFRESEREEPSVARVPNRGRFAPVLVFGVAVSVLFGGVVAAIGVMRYLGYSAPNFDFGIFCQMFENMAKTGAPVTTVERDGALSHFAVHTSPILYLLLPFYRKIAANSSTMAKNSKSFDALTTLKRIIILTSRRTHCHGMLRPRETERRGQCCTMRGSGCHFTRDGRKRKR